MKTRCFWVNDSQKYIDYHDKEWGLPVFEDAVLFEFLILETFQAGLSWITILNKEKILEVHLIISITKESQNIQHLSMHRCYKIPELLEIS